MHHTTTFLLPEVAHLSLAPSIKICDSRQDKIRHWISCFLWFPLFWIYYKNSATQCFD